VLLLVERHQPHLLAFPPVAHRRLHDKASTEREAWSLGGMEA
jgi:hypothetical protein